jgi:hypothetical protein
MNDNGLLDDWIYSESRLIGSFDKDLIEKHGQAQLARSLASRKLIAVVGSGISVAYGQPNWKLMLKATAESVVETLLAKLSVEKEDIKSDDLTDLNERKWLRSEFTWPGLIEALDAFYAFGLPDGVEDIDNDKLPLAFELCENLFALTKLWEKSKKPEPFVPRVEERRAHDELREQLKWRLRDERGRFEILLRRLFKREDWQDQVELVGGRWKPKGEDNGGRKSDLIRVFRHLSFMHDAQQGIQSRGSDRFASAFTYHLYHLGLPENKIDDIACAILRDGGNYKYCKGLATRLAEVLLPETKPREAVDGPDRRPIIDFLLECLKPGVCAQFVSTLAQAVFQHQAFKDADADETWDSTKPIPSRISGGNDEAIKAARNKARQMVPRLRDPIAIMVEDLSIKRFLTTNYDGEIDKYFEARGYFEPPKVGSPGVSSLDPEQAITPMGSRSIVMDATGNRVEFSAYEPGAAAFLFDYGADTRDQRHRILHIHGRGRKRDSWLVLSERDYRERYARDDAPNARSDDAMRLIFTGNPLMFVGLGMSEPDILRPLRTFTQDVSRMIDRPAIAVMPGESQKIQPSDDENSDLMQLGRYGVYALRYHHLKDAENTYEATNLPDDKKEKKLPKLALVLGLVRGIQYKITAENWLKWDDGEKSKQIDKYLNKKANALNKVIAPLQKRDESKGLTSEERHLLFILKLLQTVQGSPISKVEKKEAVEKAIISGFMGSVKAMVLTLYSCSYLKQTQANWEEWRKRWSAYPKRREPFGQQPMTMVTTSKESISSWEAKKPKSAGDQLDKFQLKDRHIHSTRHRVLLKKEGTNDQNARSAMVQGNSQDYKVVSNDRLTPPQTDRFLTGAPAPALPLLRASLGMKVNGKRVLADPSQGRRTFFLMGSRGMGRGQMFSAMQAPVRFAQLCGWLKLHEHKTIENEDAALGATKGIHRAFYNLGMSHEVNSVFDRLAHFLREVVRLEATRRGIENTSEIQRELDELNASRSNRVLALRTCLRALIAVSKARRPILALKKPIKRTVVVIDHFSILFTQQGRPKNAQIRRIYDVLMDPEYGEAPIDFIFLMNDGYMPHNLRCEHSQQNMESVSKNLEKATGTYGGRPPLGITQLYPIWLYPDALSVDRKEVNIGRLRRAGLLDARDDLTPLSQNPQRSVRAQSAVTKGLVSETSKLLESRVYVSLLEPPHPGTLAARFFPDTAVALAILGISNSSLPPPIVHYGESAIPADDPRPNWQIGSNHVEAANEIRDIFEGILKMPDSEETLAQLVKIYAASEKDDPVEDTSITLALARVTSNFEDKATKTHLANANSHKTELLKSSKSGSAEDLTDHVLKSNSWVIEKELAESRSYFQTISRVVGHNRYAMTVMLAAIDDMIARRRLRKPEHNLNLKPIKDFITRVSLATANRTRDSRSDLVIDHVLDTYKSDHTSSLGSALPIWPFSQKDLEETIETIRIELEKADPNHGRIVEAIQVASVDPLLLFALQEQILITLAMIGQPVEPGVLAAVSGIASKLKTIAERLETNHAEDGLKLKIQQLILLLVLDLMVRRCLIFRIAPKGDEAEVAEYGRQRHRFATHKVMRRNIFRRYDMPSVDYAEIDQVTVSLYATQPNDLPRPKAEAHRRIRSLVDQLSNYERNLDEHTHPFGDAYFDPGVRENLLDALASGVQGDPSVKQARHILRARVRAAYGIIRSVYSVGVVSRFSTYEDDGLPTPEHGYFESHRLRVRWLIRMANLLDGTTVEPKDDHKEDDGTRTFHAEEIVWLFNECGVLSLAQGRLSDAAQLFQNAENCARRFLEQSEWGALHARIGLNAAITDIERGHLRRAEGRLRQIIGDRSETDPMALIAEGYLGQIAVCQGDTYSAFDRLERSAKGLNTIGRSRAAAIMLLHHSDGLRLFNGHDPAHLRSAEELARKACDLAAKGGHEDIRQIGQLSQVWLEIASTEGRATKDQKEAIDRRLDGIEAYAKVMAMPRLQCRVALARSAFLLAEGENRIAAEVAQSALQIATRHDMELRKVSALALLGTAMLRQALRGPVLQRRSIDEARMLLQRARELAYGLEFNAEVSRVEKVLAECS